jgi:hypothetical protein
VVIGAFETEEDRGLDLAGQRQAARNRAAYYCTQVTAGVAQDTDGMKLLAGP